MNNTKSKFVRSLAIALVLVSLAALLVVNVFGKYRKTVTLTGTITYRNRIAASVQITPKETSGICAEIAVLGKTEKPADLFVLLSGTAAESFLPGEDWKRTEESPVRSMSGVFYQYQQTLPAGDSSVLFAAEGSADADTQINMTAYLIPTNMRDVTVQDDAVRASSTCFFMIPASVEPETETPDTAAPTEPPEVETQAPTETTAPTEPETERPQPPVTEAPTETETEVPATEAPTEAETETPATEAPAESEPEVPATEAPAEIETEAPTTEAPATDAPGTEEQTPPVETNRPAQPDAAEDTNPLDESAED